MIKISYQKGHVTEVSHESGARLETQLPKEVGGKGESFSPTDLLGVALGSCILTVMGLVAQKGGFDFTGTTAEVEKSMVADPKRRIGKVVVRVRCPHLPAEALRQKLEKAAAECPVHLSLHPKTKQEIDFIWGI